jgi:phage-related minor tail protein
MLSAKKGTGTAADAFKALGVEVTNADGSLKEGDAVWQETIAALGNMENETERDAAAMQLMGKSASELNPLIEDGGETYKNFAETLDKYGLEFIDQETLNQANEFKDSIDSIKSIGLIAFQQLGTQMAAYLAPAMEKVVDLVGRIANWISQLSPRTQTIIASIAGVLAVAAPLLIAIGKMSMGIGAIIKLIAVIGPAIGGIVAALGPVILIIGAVVAAGVLLYKNWDTIKAKAIALKNNIINVFNQVKAQVVSIWNGIKDAITKPITTAINTVKNAIAKIKSIINGAHLSLPHFKLPHFRIYGGKLPWGIGGKGTAPRISVDWYAQGGIFDKASIIGVGEAGAEAVVPLDKFWDKLDNMSTGSTNIVININGANKDPREIADEVRRMLIKETNQRRLAWQ